MHLTVDVKVETYMEKDWGQREKGNWAKFARKISQLVSKLLLWISERAKNTKTLNIIRSSLLFSCCFIVSFPLATM